MNFNLSYTITYSQYMYLILISYSLSLLVNFAVSSWPCCITGSGIFLTCTRIHTLTPTQAHAHSKGGENRHSTTRGVTRLLVLHLPSSESSLVMHTSVKDREPSWLRQTSRRLITLCLCTWRINACWGCRGKGRSTLTGCSHLG